MNYTAFLEGLETDDKGRMFDDILRWSNIHLEFSHNYIQRIFPTDEPSKYDRTLKPVTNDDVLSIIQSKRAKSNIGIAYLKLLSLWKLDGENYKNTKIYRYWNKDNNHNHLRITRMLKCFRLIQMNDELKDFSNRLSYLLDHNGLKISKKTEEIWRANFYYG